MIKVVPFKDHLLHKNKVLDLIKKMPHVVRNDYSESLTKTDFYLPANEPREYWDYFYSHLQTSLVDMASSFKSEYYIIHQAWFQQYKKKNFHGWHNHSGCQFSNVYFLELPDTEIATEFEDGSKVEVKEGDILTFSSHLYHRSPINKSNKRKSVVVFNSSFEGYVS
jgi:hypothetical protein|tara:strand:- start:545 stop:1042 length:498 start_codon:yes stop_codon:yes gene_type:complete